MIPVFDIIGVLVVPLVLFCWLGQVHEDLEGLPAQAHPGDLLIDEPSSNPHVSSFFLATHLGLECFSPFVAHPVKLDGNQVTPQALRTVFTFCSTQ